MFLNILVKFDPLRFSTFCMTSGNMMLFLTATKEKLRKHRIKIAFSSDVKTMALLKISLRISDHEKNFNITFSTLLHHIVKFESQNMKFMQRMTLSFLPQMLNSCISANVHNFKSACSKYRLLTVGLLRHPTIAESTRPS